MPAIRLAESEWHLLAAKDAALLAILAVEGATSRARLASMVWPEAGPNGGRNNLRQRLFRLHRLAGVEVFLQGESMSLSTNVEHDLIDPAAALAADATAMAGELLGSISYDAEPELARWVENARQKWRNRLRDVLAGLAARHESEHQIAAALPYAERLARDEPLLEHAQRQLMQLHYRRGDRGSALAVYERLRAVLDRELGETPSLESQQLASLVEASLKLPVASPEPVPIAVLCPPRLVGREREWQVMEAAWSKVTPMLLVGEPGIGKSRLLGDFADAHELRCRVQARPGDSGVPYALLSRLLRSLYGLGHAATAPTPNILDPWVRSELARFVPEFGEAAKGPVVKVRLRSAVECALRSAAAVGVLFDDLQFADEATLEMLTSGQLRGSGMQWLLATRRGEMTEGLQAWVDGAPPDELAVVAIGPLDAPAVEALLQTVAQGDADVQAIALSLHRHSGGNPMFLLQTLLEWMRQGRQAVVDGHALPFPADIVRMVQRRIESLSKGAIKLARLAALAGTDFDVDLAAAVLQRHPLDLLEAWRELEQVQVINEQAFVHDLVREACIDGVPRPIRLWLHEHIARWLGEHRPSTPPARLATHWTAAGHSASAARAWLRAAEQARAAGRTTEECRALRNAESGFASAGLVSDSFEAMVLLVIAARESQAPEQTMALAEELLSKGSNAREKGIALKELGVCHMRSMRMDTAASLLLQAGNLLHECGDVHHHGHARYLHAMTIVRSAGAEKAVAELESLLPWAERWGDESDRQCFYADLATVLDQADQRRRAEPYFVGAIKHFEKTGEAADLAGAHVMLGRSLVHLGELQRGTEHFEQAFNLRQGLSEGGGAHGIEALTLARALIEGGRYGQAIALLEPSVESLTSPDAVVLRAAFCQALARAFAMVGQYARARQTLGTQPEAAPPFHHALNLWTEALCAFDRPADRRRLLLDAVSKFDRADMPYVRLPIQFDLLALLGDGEALVKAQALMAECGQRELFAARLVGRARVAQLLAANKGQQGQIEHEVLTALEDLRTIWPEGGYVPDLLHACGVAAKGAALPELAHRCLATARQWIMETALPNVPPEFQESFLHRHVVNREVLTLFERVKR